MTKKENLLLEGYNEMERGYYSLLKEFGHVRLLVSPENKPIIQNFLKKTLCYKFQK